MPSAEPRRVWPAPALRKSLLLGLGLALLSKTIQFAIDSQPLLFPDSMAFVVNAIAFEAPERSFFYSLLIRLLALPFHTLQPILLLQMLMGASVAGLIVFVLIRYCRVRTSIALTAALLFAWDPTQIVHEHLILTETTAGLIAAVFLITALEYLRTARLILLPLLGLLGFGLVGVRLVYVPMVYVAALILPLAAVVPQTRMRRSIALLLSLVSISAGQWAFTHLVGWLMDREPAYHYRTGIFALGDIAPIVIPGDARDPRAKAAILQQQQVHPANPEAWDRNLQLWGAGGLIDILRRNFEGDTDRADAEARQIVRSAILRNPVGFFRLGLVGLRDFARTLRHEAGPAQAIENGSDPRVQIDPGAWAPFLQHFSNPHPGNTMEMTPSRQFHLHSTPWSWMQFLSPLLGLLSCLFLRGPQRQAVAFLAAWGALLIATTCLTTPIALRYLHPLSFTLSITLAVTADWMILRQRSEHLSPVASK